MYKKSVGVKIMKEAMYYKKLNAQKVQCLLCPHYCVIPEGDIGICRGKKNINGKLFAINYGKTVTVAIDPIEKKPLYHFLPGTQILSIASNSCNFDCHFCQNYHISQFDADTFEISPEMIYKYCMDNNIKEIAFTYTEPITWYEFIYDASKYLKKFGIKTVMVTNGFINLPPLKKLLPYIDAMNIDLKAMDDDFYKNLCNGRLLPVLETIRYAAKHTHLEITNLIITNENDSQEKLSELIDFIAEINPNIPLHFSKYYPTYKMHNPATPEKTLYLAKELAKGKLNYVYLGNILSDNNTYCPNCGTLLIKRNYKMTENYLQLDKCPKCNYKIYGVWE